MIDGNASSTQLLQWELKQLFIDGLTEYFAKHGGVAAFTAPGTVAVDVTPIPKVEKLGVDYQNIFGLLNMTLAERMAWTNLSSAALITIRDDDRDKPETQQTKFYRLPA